MIMRKLFPLLKRDRFSVWVIVISRAFSLQKHDISEAPPPKTSCSTQAVLRLSSNCTNLWWNVIVKSISLYVLSLYDLNKYIKFLKNRSLRWWNSCHTMPSSPIFSSIVEHHKYQCYHGQYLSLRVEHVRIGKYGYRANQSEPDEVTLQSSYL